ncbi:MAG TPA: translation initiation factor IF-2 [Candidatus Paceibacterota bacterium]|nr:translation initiation factor IF-2 [Verrucomicrobiota bacterium]HRZ45308.1 translation initiation factor IF-2 [Candidatus Paceibacterota bacterium]
MPVRIYDIAKKLGIESKEVLARAKDLGITYARVPSSTLDKITAEYLEEQISATLVKPAPPPPPPAERPAPPAEPAAVEPLPTPPEADLAPAAPPPPAAELPSAPPPEAVLPAAEPEPPAPAELAPAPPPAPIAPALVEIPAPPSIESDSAPAAHVEIVTSHPAETTATPPPVDLIEPAAQAPAEAVESAVESGSDISVEPEPPPVEPPAPPLPPPPPRVGDKIGFIQLPPRPVKSADRSVPPGPPQRSGRGGPADRRVRPGPPLRGGAPAGTRTPSTPGAGRGGKPTPAQSPAPFAPPAEGELITMKPPIVVRMLAELLKRKPYQLIGDLIELGVFANVNQTIEETIAQRLCAKYGFRFQLERRDRGGGMVHTPQPPRPPQISAVDERPEDLKPRPPVITIMGHVDHGKTTLLDVIRKSNVVATEAGGITQHIGAYTIFFPHPERPKEIQQITFLDTPGHAAFSAMRARGANVTDLVILVVAANDGVMPQTHEAISHAKAAGVPILVAVNKCDHPHANPGRVRQQLQEHGLICEEWGGNTIFVDVSALAKTGIDKLLSMILLQAEMLELKANPKRPAQGNVIESGLAAGGPTATVLVRKGTLKQGDMVLCGPCYGKARALVNQEGKRVPSAGPSVAVQLLGLNGVPDAGVEFSVVENEKDARDLANERAAALRNFDLDMRPKVTFENLFATLASGAAKVLKVVVKGDAQGSVEAIVEALKKIEATKVTLEIIHAAVGIITESDVQMASASRAIIIGFHTRIDSAAAELAKREGVEIKLYSIIYELIDQVKDAMAGLLEPIVEEVFLGSAEVRKIFELSKGGCVAGSIVTSGRVVKGRCRVLRRKDRLFEGAIASLRRFQDEVSEVRSGMECGLRLDGFTSFQPGDVIECYTVKKIPQKL